MIRPVIEIERWITNRYPWGYERHPGDTKRKAIESVLKQVALSDEILLIDDCFVDNSLEAGRRNCESIRIETNETSVEIIDNFNYTAGLRVGGGRIQS